MRYHVCDNSDAPFCPVSFRAVDNLFVTVVGEHMGSVLDPPFAGFAGSLGFLVSASPGATRGCGAGGVRD
eukprot:2577305-Lingulodinium_polyedra.AAC.1